MAIITTIHGEMDEAVLEKREGGHDNEREECSWIEYWYQNELVHRSVKLHLKQGISFDMDAGALA